jgi:hypothetical protein
MKKSLLIFLASLAFAPIANCGIGGIPGNFTLDSLGPGKSSPAEPKPTAVVTTVQKRERLVAGIADPGKRKASRSAGRDHRSRLQPL